MSNPVDRAIDPSPELSHARVVDDDDALGDVGALLDPEGAENVKWYVYRMDADGPRGPKGRRRYVVKYEGPLDIEQIRQDCGGGKFKISGFLNNKPFRNGVIEIEGVPRIAPNERQLSEPEAPPTSHASVPTRDDRLERLERLVEQLVVASRASSPTSGDQLIKAIELVDRIRGERGNDNTPIDSALSILQKGIELGSTAAPREGTDWGQVIREARPIVESFLVNMQRRTAQHGNAGPSPPPAHVPEPEPQSSAAVVREPDDNDRVLVFVDALVRAFLRDEHPSAMADAAEVMLIPEDLTLLRAADTELLLSQIPQLDRFKVLRSEKARAWLDSFLDELRRPADLEQPDE